MAEVLNGLCRRTSNLVPAMSKDHANVFILSRVNKALRADFQHLSQADTELSAMLRDARNFGEQVLPASSVNAAWLESWDTVLALLNELRLYTAAMKEEMEENASSPLAAFDVVIARDERLHRTLHELSAREDEVKDESSRSNWVDLWESVGSQLDIIRSYLAAIRTRIEMRRKHGDQESQRMQEEVLSNLPIDSSLTDAGKFAEEYEKAFQSFQRDKHRTGGLIDVFKGLLLIQEEGPGAKLSRKRNKSEF